jgi:hypothetical protein
LSLNSPGIKRCVLFIMGLLPIVALVRVFHHTAIMGSTHEKVC